MPITAQGVVHQILVQNNQTIVMVDKAVYMLPPELVANPGSSLQVGVTLQLTAVQRSDGTLAIQTVVVASSPDKKRDNDHDEEKLTEYTPSWN